MVGPESRIDSAEMRHASRQHTGGGKQPDAQRHLRDTQTSLYAAERARGRDACARIAQGLVAADANMNRRKGAGHDRDKERDAGREREHGSVDANVAGDGQVHR